MFTISLEVIDWEADTLQYQNGDDIYIISTKKTKTTPSTTEIEKKVNITTKLSVKCTQPITLFF